MTRDVAVLVTTFNRPKLVTDAIASVLQQDRAKLIILDDGCNEQSRHAINEALGKPGWLYEQECAGGVATSTDAVTWWRGPDRPMAERKASIPYSRTLNIALNNLLRGEKYISYLCDDDFLLPDSIRLRAEYLDAHPEAHVVYGRLRSIQYGHNGFNAWTDSTAPQAGTAFLAPDGQRVFNRERGNGRHYYTVGRCDPITGLPYVEEGYWLPGPMRYGVDGAPDHNQITHRVECLTACGIAWPKTATGTEFWGEDIRYGVGDAEFFRRLGTAHEFVGVDCWAVSKKYHGLSDGVAQGEVRE